MRKYILFLICAALLASCGSKRQLAGSATGNIPGMGKGAGVADVVRMVNANRVSEPSLSAKISLSIGTSNNSARVGGSLKMKRDDVIQISLVALGLMEVGRLELTPDYMMVVDRMNRQYVKCGYSEVDFFRQSGIDFYTFQSLFWDELFVLEGKGEVPADDNFQLKMEEGEIRLVNVGNRNIALTFVVDAANLLVGETSFAGNGTDSPVLKWKYEEWSKLGEQLFPGAMKISFRLPKDDVEAVFRISSVKPDATWETRTEVNRNRYTEISPQAAFRRIMSLAL